MNINFSMLRGRETIAERHHINDYTSQSGASTPLGDKQVLGKALFEIVGSKILTVLQKYRMTTLIP